ncbi:MAG: PaaI family thioesterase [Deltaproteobacteria bacterium]|nr:MAG: PaaI family thioesterase [Deltaproteobacteria bacterium]
MKRLNPAYLEAVAKKVSVSPYFTLISMEITNLDWGQSRLEVVVEEKHLQPFGMVHGGVYASVVDAAAFWAVYPQIDEGLGITTVELKLNYLAPTSTGSLIAKGKSIKVGKSLCLGEAYVEDETGKLLAHGTETMMVLKDLKIWGHAELPPKF